ncbi:unnamed protein product [Coregonus sp. 'balchen']|nr:unnamed protein product [Coregonus sp. 'balchen']
MQMHSKFLDRKHASYLRQHQELCAMIANFLQFLLLRKPSNVFMFPRKDFASRRLQGGTFNTSP